MRKRWRRGRNKTSKIESAKNELKMSDTKKSDTKKKEEALRYHSSGRPGKIQVVPTKPHSTQRDLALAYSPGVAEPCLEIQRQPEDAYKYTDKGG